ncbi:Na(+)/H(+) antiporter subunit E [compost metagenome]
MGSQLILNIVIAFVWMFLFNEVSPLQLAIGYVVGAVMIGGLRRFWPGDFYLIRLWAVLKLLGLFIRELFVSGITVAGHILRPRLAVRPGIFAYRTALKSDWEITLLSCLICLTPGTLTLDVSPDKSTLYIHAMDMGDVEEMIGQIRTTFEKAILEVTRS